MKAVVLVNTKFYAETEVLKEITKINGVVEAFIVFGVYDIVVKCKAETRDKLREIRDEIGKINKVNSTLTLVVCVKRMVNAKP